MANAVITSGLPPKVGEPGTPTSVIVNISVRKKDKVTVDCEPFWVSEGEEVVWHCDRKIREPLHGHKAGQCFEVSFPSGSPFKGSQFLSDANGEAHSGPPTAAEAIHNHLYKYTVKIIGCHDPLDPLGGVTP